ncbi:hypothetical protein [Hydrocarboniphaga sp.]|uniref:hypothetical protein n=1 Tax=Hydrocarboniphaga sp. TaxID=2033016 RepID=UPI0026351DF9|nr:hypothetical protein [Hydrocarboniphaga sp.]
MKKSGAAPLRPSLVLAVFLCAGNARAGEPVRDRWGNIQQVDIQAEPPVAKAAIAFDFQFSYSNALGLPRPQRELVIYWPTGGRWNGALFPQCDPVLLAQQGPEVCPANSLFLRGKALAALGSQALTIESEVQGFVGLPKNGNPTQIFYIRPQIGPAFVLTGEFTEEGQGPYGLVQRFDMNAIPASTALTPSPIILTAFHSEDLHTYVTRRVDGTDLQIALTVAPDTCPADGFWHYAIESRYRLGDLPLRSVGRQPCVGASTD